MKRAITIVVHINTAFSRKSRIQHSTHIQNCSLSAIKGFKLLFIHLLKSGAAFICRAKQNISLFALSHSQYYSAANTVVATATIAGGWWEQKYRVGQMISLKHIIRIVCVFRVRAPLYNSFQSLLLLLLPRLSSLRQMNCMRPYCCSRDSRARACVRS